MTYYLTIFHNATVLPVGESVLCESDPSVYLGTPDFNRTRFTIWRAEHLRIVVSRDVLTTAA